MTDDGGELSEIVGAIGDEAPLVGTTALALWTLGKVAGPSLDAIGSALGRFTERRIANLENLGAKLARRLNANEKQFELPAAHPRLVHFLFDEASWCDDDVMQEYFAGLLYQSMQNGGVDDEAGYQARLVARLAPNFLRLHHAFYMTLIGRGGLEDIGVKASAFETYVTFDAARGVIEDEGDLNYAVLCLFRESLIDTYSVLHEAKPAPWAPGPGIMLRPNILGLGLFFSAYGIDAYPGEFDQVQLPHLQTPNCRSSTSL